MSQIIKIKDIDEAIPKKGIWYDYYGDIFVSVLPIFYQHHIRRKSKILSKKKDHHTSKWHLKWQYEIIEQKFGVNSCGHKTYEVSIFVDGEKHVIDSLVSNKIAIEFQHTLSVDLEEMNLRESAHRKAGFKPYLVLNFTNFTLEEYESGQNNLHRKLKKWHLTKYYENNNLFLDLKDFILRLSPNVKNKHLKISKICFTDNLLNLDDVLKDEINSFQKEKEKAHKRKQEKEAYYFSLEKEKNRLRKFESEDYKYFRKCFTNKKIRPYVLRISKDYIHYKSWTDDDLEKKISKKCHWYWSEENSFEIQYINISYLTETEVIGLRKSFKKKKYEFLHSEIHIIDRDNNQFYEFEIDKGITKQIK